MVAVVALAAVVVAALVGGAFGAAVGGYRAFGLAGLAVAVGEVLTVVGGGAGGSPGVLGATGLTATVGLGPALGPHVAFAGGLAAAAYAGRRGDGSDDFDYHPAKDVATARWSNPGALAAGAAFGLVGLVVTRGSAALALPWDPVMFSVVVSGFLHRVAFGYPLVGTVRGGLLDMRPFERDDRRPPVTERAARVDGGATGRPRTPNGGGEAEGEEARYLVEPWLPYQYEWGRVAPLGVAGGAFGGLTAYLTGSALLAFGITAAGLLLVGSDVDEVPVTHHAALPASIAVVGLAGTAEPAVLASGAAPAEVQGAVSFGAALLVGAAFGLVAALVGELAQRTLYAHGDTHLDPPAVAIVVTTLLIAVLDVVGVFTQNAVPTLGL